MISEENKMLQHLCIDMDTFCVYSSVEALQQAKQSSCRMTNWAASTLGQTPLLLYGEGSRAFDWRDVQWAMISLCHPRDFFCNYPSLR
jgi:hypothetical protein